MRELIKPITHLFTFHSTEGLVTGKCDAGSKSIKESILLKIQVAEQNSRSNRFGFVHQDFWSGSALEDTFRYNTDKSEM